MKKLITGQEVSVVTLSVFNGALFIPEIIKNEARVGWLALILMFVGFFYIMVMWKEDS